MQFIQNQLHMNILFQLLRFYKFIASRIKFTESLSHFPRLNINLHHMEDFVLDSQKLQWRADGMGVGDKNLIIVVLAEFPMM
jgi:hypothetical protein